MPEESNTEYLILISLSILWDVPFGHSPRKRRGTKIIDADKISEYFKSKIGFCFSCSCRSPEAVP